MIDIGFSDGRSSPVPRQLRPRRRDCAAPDRRCLPGFLLVVGYALLMAACRDAVPPTDPPDAAPRAEATSLFGAPLVPATPSSEALARLEANLAEAQQRYDAAPDDADAIIWVGRRLGYLGRFRDAIAMFTEGIAKHPDDARMYRHRGHRYITVREFAQAAEDLGRAAALTRGQPDEVEPDGIPNARNTPTSTLQSNVWYHLGLARYLMGDFEAALDAYRECLEVSKNPDMLVATSHWLYMTLRRLDRPDEAQAVLDPIDADLDVIENQAYHRLLLVYKGLEPLAALESPSGDELQDATTGYGVGNWHFYNGRRDDAVRVWRRIATGPQWAAFGAIAAEADLHRLGVTPAS